MAGFGLNIRAVFAVSKKEFMDNLRNKWIIALTVIFILLTLVASFLAGGQAGGTSALGGMEETVITLLAISSILIPLIAIMLGYATISGEAESGALSVVLAYPVRRREVLLGKFLGLSFVLVIATILGFGLGGIIISATAGAESIGGFLAFIGLTILLGVLYLSLAIFTSSIAKKRSTSLGFAIVLFFWSMIIGMVLFGIYLGTGGSFEEIINPAGGPVNFPDWMWGAMFLSPMDMSQMAIMLAFGVNQAFGVTVIAPDFFNMGTIVIALLAWIIVPMILAYYFFNKRDI